MSSRWCSPLLHPLTLKAIQPHLSILTTARHTTIAEANARHRTSVSSEAPLAFSRTRFPDLRHRAVCARDHPKCVTSKAPDALDVSEHTAHASARSEEHTSELQSLAYLV